jgi:hypothetical protein
MAKSRSESVLLAVPSLGSSASPLKIRGARGVMIRKEVLWVNSQRGRERCLARAKN